MPCTTILVGKKASYDGSTMIARNDDGFFDIKKMIVVDPKDQPRKYKSVISHVTVDLPDNPMRYTSTPNVDPYEGVWGANGINEANVAMTATETTTTNALVMGADPYVKYIKADKSKKQKEVIGGLGEEDLLICVLPYINSAREGVKRLGALLEQYGTYESNGIGFSDNDEVWWFETIGGHHWMARRVKDDEVAILPNWFSLTKFDMADAMSEQKNNMCSKDLEKFIYDNNLVMDYDGKFNPRVAFGTHSDADHIYNTPRAWYMGRYFCPKSYKWDGPNADFTPMSDDIPWAVKPDFKVTVEDVKYVLSSYYQGTEYNPHGIGDKKGIYRPIGISRTGVMAVLQIRNNVPDAIAAVEWLCFGCNAYNVAVPFYTNVDKLPAYVSSTKVDVDSDTYYWGSRLIGALADHSFNTCIQWIERYQKAVSYRGHQLLKEYDEKMVNTNTYNLLKEANQKFADMAKEETTKTLNKVLFESSKAMKMTYQRTDN